MVPPDRLLLPLAAVVLATLVHHVHNAEYLDAYPNMPAWLSPSLVYLAWLGAAAVGLLGYVLVHRGWRLLGYCALLAYAAYALDGLLHYTRAPLGAHTPTMNATIFLEALAGTLLALAVLHRAVKR
jgi:hypothetical protein